MSDPRAHWDDVYRGRGADELPWQEPIPSTLQLVLDRSRPTDPVIDVGGGTSRLARELLARGYDDVTVLDVSERALDGARGELATRAGSVRWIEADVRRWRPGRRWRLWHDRAVFHFLTTEADRDAYRRAAASAVAPGGIAVVAVFAPEGPERCAGLPVRRYDVGALAAEFAADFELLDGGPLSPSSDVGDQRPYVAAVLGRRGSTGRHAADRAGLTRGDPSRPATAGW